MAVGALVGGRLAYRGGPGPAVRRALVGIAVLVTGLAALDVVFGGAPPRALLLGALGLVYASIGVFTTASCALLMDLTRPRVAATQFSAYLGATNACEAWAAWSAGALAAHLGYPAAFAALAVASLAALPVLGRGGLAETAAR